MTPQQWKRLFARTALWGGFLAGTALLVTLAFATWNLYGKEHDVRQAHLDEQGRVNELTDRQSALQTQIAALGTDRGIEAAVRDRYPVAKPGEEEILIVTPSGTNATSSPKKTLWDTIFGWLPW